MFPVFSITITVKANLTSFNIKFKNCCSLSGSHDYKSISLRNESQRGFTMKGYNSGGLFCSLVSNFTNGGHTPQFKNSRSHTMQERMKTFLYIYIISCPSPALHKYLVLILQMRVSVSCFTGGVNQMTMVK